MGCFLDDLRAFGINADQWMTAAQDERGSSRTAEEGATFHGEMDRWGESQGWTTACNSIPERDDGKDQEEDIPKQAGSCPFARPCWLAKSGKNLYPPGVWFADAMTSFSGVTLFCFASFSYIQLRRLLGHGDLPFPPRPPPPRRRIPGNQGIILPVPQRASPGGCPEPDLRSLHNRLYRPEHHAPLQGTPALRARFNLPRMLPSSTGNRGRYFYSVRRRTLGVQLRCGPSLVREHDPQLPGDRPTETPHQGRPIGK